MTISIDGTDISSVTIDGTEVQEVTVDGNVVYSASSFNSGVGSISGTVVDDFEDGDLSEYGYGENSSNFSVDGSLYWEGSYACQCASSSASSHIYSSSGLNAYPSQGDTFRFRAHAKGTGSRIYYWFATQGDGKADGGYRISTWTSESTFKLDDKAGGVKLAEKSPSIPDSEWIEVEVNWTTSDDITVTLYDANGNQLSQLSVTDSTYTNGGVGVGFDDGEAAHDAIEIL